MVREWGSGARFSMVSSCAGEDTGVASLLFGDNDTCPEVSPLPPCQNLHVLPEDPSLVQILIDVSFDLVLTAVLAVIFIMVSRRRKHCESMGVSWARGRQNFLLNKFINPGFFTLTRAL